MSLEEKLVENDYDNVMIFKDYDYDTAFIGISNDNRAIYSYNLMIDWLIDNEGMSVDEAIEWVDYNTLGSISNQPPYPIIMYEVI